MKTILHTVDVKASPATLFKALTTRQGLAGWWSTRVDADVRVGGVVRFTFMPGFNPQMSIIALDEPKLVEWKCIGGHEPWTDNTFRFSIEPRDSGCVLLFRQEYAQELSDEEYGRYNFNWGYYLNSLKRLCETGTGTPARPEKLSAGTT